MRVALEAPATMTMRGWPRSRGVSAMASGLVAALVLVSTASHAQTLPIVSEILVEQEGLPLSDPLVHDLIEIRLGQALDIRQVRETVGHLMTLGRFDDVQVFRESAPGGVRLRIALRPTHPVDRVEFRGTLGLAESTLRRAMTDRFGIIPPAGRIDEVRRSLEAFYRTRGYTAARIVPGVEESHNPDRASLVFDGRPVTGRGCRACRSMR
jgi:outer membrane protein assembly factor BamA